MFATTGGSAGVADNEADERPICDECGGRHWLLELCAAPGMAAEAVSPSEQAIASYVPAPGEPPATQDEIARALRFYRAHRARQKAVMRRRRAKAGGGPLTS
jgi:hypothetical protein